MRLQIQGLWYPFWLGKDENPIILRSPHISNDDVSMATAAIIARQADEAKRQHQQGAASGGGEGLRQYYQQTIQDLQLLSRQKHHDLQRLEAQRNDLNARGFLQFAHGFK